MVPHYAPCTARFKHRSYNAHRLDLFRTSVDQISDEDRLAFLVSPHSAAVFVPKFDKKALEYPGVPVHVPNDVVPVH